MGLAGPREVHGPSSRIRVGFGTLWFVGLRMDMCHTSGRIIT